jgi:hypothetical protein
VEGISGEPMKILVEKLEARNSGIPPNRQGPLDSTVSKFHRNRGFLTSI